MARNPKVLASSPEVTRLLALWESRASLLHRTNHRREYRLIHTALAQCYAIHNHSTGAPATKLRRIREIIALKMEPFWILKLEEPPPCQESFTSQPS